MEELKDGQKVLLDKIIEQNEKIINILEEVHNGYKENKRVK
jgi:hypothetical protein